MRKITLPILLCTAFAIPTLTQAASPMNPGLWEISTQSDAMKKPSADITSTSGTDAPDGDECSRNAQWRHGDEGLHH